MTPTPHVVTGVDRTSGAWVAATLAVDHGGRGRLLNWRLGDRFLDVVDQGATTCAIDIPIGLAEEGWRVADLEARQVLPGPARSRVFVTPPRPVVENTETLDNEAIQELCRDLTGSGISRQALALATSILDVERALIDDSELRDRTIEVHPELSFAAMSGSPALAPKKTAVGVARRQTALAGAWSLDVTAALTQAPQGVAVDDCLDALAAAWSGWRHAVGAAHTYPPAPHPVDAHGLRMAITV